MTWQMYFADGRGLCQTQRRSRLWSTAAREPSFMRWEMAHFFYKSHHRGQHWSTIKSSKHQIQKIVNRESSMFLLSLWRCLLRQKVYWDKTSRSIRWHFQGYIIFCFFSTQRTFCLTLAWTARAASFAPSARRTRRRSWATAWSGRSSSSSSREFYESKR